MDIVNILAEHYAENFSSPGDTLQCTVVDKTFQNHPHAHMLSGHVQGKLLETISCLLQPKRILEIGTFTGFSALCLAKGLQPDGELHTLELRAEDAATALQYFDQSAAKDKIKLHIGDARQIIPTLKETWDIVFIDADKTGYIEYYELILPSVKTNGIIIADNVLFHGAVLEENISGKNAKAIHAFNEHVKNDIRTEQVLLTVRDGLLLIRKL
ncbi:MAG: O-methyltransferase [Sphingobacteriales bacterium]|nr:O-methyltransferase [Sphingobacteriales bacterium]